MSGRLEADWGIRATEFPHFVVVESGLVEKKLDYGFLLRKASISIVNEILEHIANDGLYKKQHIYVTFALNHPDVKVSQLLRKDYEDEMTIVLQYEFWDLIVDDYGFSVSLAFEHSDETIYVPFAAMISVSDPSEDFNLEFTPNFAELKPKVEKPQATKSSDKVISLDIFRKK